MDERKQTMTLNVSEREMKVITQLAREAELSKTAVIRQALRLYQIIYERTKAGETMHFSGDKERLVLLVGPGFDGGLDG